MLVAQQLRTLQSRMTVSSARLLSAQCQAHKLAVAAPAGRVVHHGTSETATGCSTASSHSCCQPVSASCSTALGASSTRFSSSCTNTSAVHAANTYGRQRSFLGLCSSSNHWHQLVSKDSQTFSTSSSAFNNRSSSQASGASQTLDSLRGFSSKAADGSSSTNSATSSSSSTAAAGPSMQVPPAVAAGAAAASAAASKAAKSVAKQASRLVKLVQATSLSEATWLQLTSIWQSHSATITAVTAAAATAGVYQLIAAAAGHLVDVSDPTIHLSCLTASAAAVTAAGLQIRSSFTVDPERVYRITMRKLNRHAGLQEVLGTPLAGSDVRLELVMQGSLFVQETLLPKRRAPRIHLVFQLTGPSKTGVVSVEAKKAFGSKYAFKTLMVELPDKTLNSKAAGAAAVAAAAEVRSGVSSSSSTVTAAQAGGETGPSSQGYQPSSSGSSSGDGGSTQTGAAATEPARIYLIGQPAGTGTNSSSATRHLSPSVLLEDLKEPLLFALKQNLAGYEAEDETEGQLAWSKPQQDPDQTTWWDDTKKGSQVFACRAYTAVRAAASAAVTAVGTASSKLRAQAAAAAASSRGGKSSSSSSTDSRSPNSSTSAGQGPAAASAAVGPQSSSTSSSGAAASADTALPVTADSKQQA